MESAINNNNVAVHADNKTTALHNEANKETAFLKDATFTAAQNENDTSLRNPRSMYDLVMLYFDSFSFNKQFDAYIKTVQENTLLEQKITTDELNKIENMTIPPYADTVPNILIKTKQAWGNIIFGKSKFNNNDLFYISITLIIIAVLYILLSYIFT